jgi:CheY-like chemotaxis protein
VAALPQGAFGAAIRRDLVEIVLFGAALLMLGLVAAVHLSRRLVGALHAAVRTRRAGCRTKRASRARRTCRAAAGGVSGRILLVVDDDSVRDTLMEQSQALAHKALAASGGTDALAILRAREAVDLMITDLPMPGMNGLMLIKDAQGPRSRLPAILLTGYAVDAVELERSGVARDTYTLMRKPATTAALSARVTALLARSLMLDGDGDAEIKALAWY